MVHLVEGQKFALVAITRCRTAVNHEVDLGSGTVALPQIVDVLDPSWRTWLGQSRTDEVDQANLVLLRTAISQNSTLLNDENDRLVQRVTDVWALLQFSGIVERNTSICLTGSIVNGAMNVRQVRTVRSFYTARGAQSTRATIARLRQADAYSETWEGVLASGQFKRFIRGSNVLMDGLHEYYGQERLHQCVRALEALLLPRIGATQRQFVHRCQTFTLNNAVHATMLSELFAMRSAVEHLHDVYEPLTQQYPDEPARVRVAERRTRQAEALATYAYRRLLENPAIRTHFETDVALAGFWHLQDHERKTIWGAPFDLAAVQ